MNRPVALVTGASRGIGRATALALAADGFDIAGTDLTVDATAQAASSDTGSGAGARFEVFRHDVGEVGGHADLVAKVVAHFGGVDVLVNNAGRGPAARGDCLDISPANFDAVMAVNLRGTIFFTQAVVKAMLAQPARRPCSVITVTSISAEMASPERADYCVSKAGLSMWVKNLALRLASENIAVFEVRPGIIRTDMTAPVAHKYHQRIADGLVPMRRWGEPEDVARAISLLASGQIGFATGSVISPDGGLSLPRL